MTQTPIVTTAGASLLIRAMNGEILQFTRFKVGNGSLPSGSDGTALTDLINAQITFGIVETDDTNEGYLTVKGRFSSDDVPAQMLYRELGLFAMGEDGVEVLYCYANDGDKAGVLLPTGDTVYTQHDVTFVVAIGQAEHVTATLVPDMIYAAKADLDAHVADTNNPHGVTAAQIGLGNVQNVSTNNQTPTYTDAESPAALSSGERISVAFGKISAAVKALISHLSDKNNPHAVTAAQAGAAATMHTHGASDISSGTLSVERGGTGVSDETSLKNLIFSKKYGSITFQTGYKPYGNMTNQILVMQVGKTIMVDATIWADSAFPSSRTKIAKITGVTLPIFTERSLCDTNNTGVNPEEFHPSKFDIDPNGYIWIHSNGTDNQAHIHMVYMTN